MVGQSVAATVVDDDPEVPREVVHLGLPEPGVGDRVCGQEDDRLGAASEDLVVEAQAVGGQRVAGGVRLPRARARFGDWHLDLPSLGEGGRLRNRPPSVS